MIKLDSCTDLSQFLNIHFSETKIDWTDLIPSLMDVIFIQRKNIFCVYLISCNKATHERRKIRPNLISTSMGQRVNGRSELWEFINENLKNNKRGSVLNFINLEKPWDEWRPVAARGTRHVNICSTFWITRVHTYKRCISYLVILWVAFA